LFCSGLPAAELYDDSSSPDEEALVRPPERTPANEEVPSTAGDLDPGHLAKAIFLVQAAGAGVAALPDRDR